MAYHDLAYHPRLCVSYLAGSLEREPKPSYRSMLPDSQSIPGQNFLLQHPPTRLAPEMLLAWRHSLISRERLC